MTGPPMRLASQLHMALVLLCAGSHLRLLVLVTAVGKMPRNWKSAVMQMRTIGHAQDGTFAAIELTSTPLTIGVMKS